MQPLNKVRPTRLDAVLLPLLAAAAGYVVWLFAVGLDYQWRWSSVLTMFARRDPETGALVANILTQGLLTTLKLSVWSMGLALVIGTLMGVAGAAVAGSGRRRGRLFWRLVAGSYVTFVRNTPPLVLIFLFYFFIGDQIMAWLGVEDLARGLAGPWQEALTFLAAPPARFTAFCSAVLTLALYEGAYIAEIVRAGILSVERGQWEAAYALGLSPRQRLMRVVLPQAFRRSVPSLAGQFIATIKASSIVSVISIPELTFQAMAVMASTSRVYEVWLTVFACYLVLCLSLSLASRRLEAWFARRG